MPDTTTLLGFSLIALSLVLTPGPHMLHLVSRSICQGRTAGGISLGGVTLGFVFYMLCAAFGITALLMAVPHAYDALRIGGAAYLLWLAWQAIRPGGRSPFQVRALPVDRPHKLLAMGLVTNLLNPRIAVMYLSLLLQFVDLHRGSVPAQSRVLGTTQILISIGVVNAAIAVTAGGIVAFLAAPGMMAARRWLMGTVLAGLVVRMATEARR